MADPNCEECQGRGFFRRFNGGNPFDDPCICTLPKEEQERRRKAQEEFDRETMAFADRARKRREHECCDGS
jgi:hypothetical protein